MSYEVIVGVSLGLLCLTREGIKRMTHTGTRSAQARTGFCGSECVRRQQCAKYQSDRDSMRLAAPLAYAQKAWRALVLLAMLLQLLFAPFPAPSYSLVSEAATRESTPVASGANGCTVEPRPVEDFSRVDRESKDGLSRMLGTPIATPLPPSGGSPAGPSIVAAVTKTMEEVTACTNATDLRRLAALLTDEQFRRTFGGIGQQFLTSLGTPTGLPEGESAPRISVSDVIVLPDGRVSAITEANGRKTLTVFREVNGAFLIDASYDLPLAGTPVP